MISGSRIETSKIGDTTSESSNNIKGMVGGLIGDSNVCLVLTAKRTAFSAAFNFYLAESDPMNPLILISD